MNARTTSSLALIAALIAAVKPEDLQAVADTLKELDAERTDAIASQGEALNSTRDQVAAALAAQQAAEAALAPSKQRIEELTVALDALQKKADDAPADLLLLQQRNADLSDELAEIKRVLDTAKQPPNAPPVPPVPGQSPIGVAGLSDGPDGRADETAT